MRTTILAASLILAGCMTSQPQPDWYDASDQAALKAHLDDCIATGQHATANDPIATRFEQNKLADLCMEIRGYKRKNG
jgi:hypothetical protein